MNRYLKIGGLIPYFNLIFGTGREQKRIAEIILTKPEKIKELFTKDDTTDKELKSLLNDISEEEEKSQATEVMGTNTAPSDKKLHSTPSLSRNDDITDKKVKSLLHGISEKKEKPQTTEEYLDLVKKKILKCYSAEGKKQLGDRIFGYLVKSEFISAHTPKERLNAWHALMGTNTAPCDTRLHTNPSLNRSTVDSDTLLKHLDSIHEFYIEIGLFKTANIIKKNKDNLSETI